ncbi:MAG: outer membrane protein assembly factor BamE, partial [Victivallaceae bacterium]
MALLLTFVVLFGGCGFSEANRNLKSSEALRIGMTKEEVIAVMGEPIRNETYTKP